MSAATKFGSRVLSSRAWPWSDANENPRWVLASLSSDWGAPPSRRPTYFVMELSAVSSAACVSGVMLVLVAMGRARPRSKGGRQRSFTSAATSAAWPMSIPVNHWRREDFIWSISR